METNEAIVTLRNHLVFGKFHNSRIIDAIRIAIKALERQRWIPCSVRLPETFPSRAGTEYSETVYVYTSDGKIMAAFRRKGFDGEAHWVAPFDFWETCEEYITHWAEFPPLPEEKERGLLENVVVANQ